MNRWRLRLLTVFLAVLLSGCIGGSDSSDDSGTNDTTAPTVNAFTLPSTASSLTVAITSLTATDNTGVTGYLITSSASAPSASASEWSTSAPTSFTFSASGNQTAYAWAKDAAGNVSAARTTQIAITLPSSGSAVIALVAPSQGSAGSTFIISGEGINRYGATPLVKLGATTAGATLMVGGLAIQVVVPSNLAAGNYTVTVSQQDGSEEISAPGTFGVVATGTAGGVTLSAAFGGSNGPTSVPNTLDLNKTVIVGPLRSYYWGPTLPGSYLLSLAYDGSPGTQMLMLEISKDSNTPAATLNNGTFIPGMCGLPGNTAGGPTCASLGINFNSTAGTVTFTNVAMTYTRGGTGSAGTLNGTLNFAPF